MIKRVTDDKFNSALVQYMKRRNYPENEIHSSRIQPTDLDEMSVHKRSHISAGVQNTVSYSSMTADFTSCDTQFAQLRKFVLESSPQQNEELSALLFPIFVHIYASLLAVGPKVSAQKFHERHCEVFHAEQQKDFVRSLRKLESKAELQAAKDISDFIEHRHTVRLSHASINHLLTHLRTADNMIILEILNRSINIVATYTHEKTLDLHGNFSSSSTAQGQGKHSRGEKSSEKDPVKKDLQKDVRDECQPPQPQGSSRSTKPLSEPNSELSQTEREDLQRLEEASRKLECLPPPLPSILFYTVINASVHQGLSTSTISPDNRLLSGGFEDSSVRLYRLQPIPLPTAYTDCNNSRLTLAADYIVKDEAERQVDVDSSSEEGVTLHAHNGPVYKTQFTPDSSHLLSCSRDKSVRLWNLATRTNVAIYKGHSGSVWDIDYCPATNHFASSSRDQTVKLWTLDQVYPLRSFIGHEMDIQTVAIHPNGNYLASGSADRTVRLWDIQDGRCLRVMCAHRGSVLSLAFSPNGLMLASAGDDRRVYLWDLNKGKVRKELRGHTDTLYCLAFSPCNDLLASGGHDCVIRLWDIRSGGDSGGQSSLLEGHTSSELMGAYPTKSAVVTFLSFPHPHLMHAVGASH